MKNFNKRIDLLINELGLSQHEFARTVGLSRMMIAHYISGRSKPKLETIIEILAKYPQVNRDWLLLGRGDEIITPSLYKDSVANEPTGEYIAANRANNSFLNSELQEKNNLIRSQSKQIEALTKIIDRLSVDKKSSADYQSNAASKNERD